MPENRVKRRHVVAACGSLVIDAAGWGTYAVMHPHLPVGMECKFTWMVVTLPLASLGAAWAIGVGALTLARREDGVVGGTLVAFGLLQVLVPLVLLLSACDS